MEKGFSSGDICAIIKACGEAGVSKFVLGSLSFEIGHAPQVQYAPFVAEGRTQAIGVLNDELALKEERLAHMDVEDPVQYEKLLMSGDLVSKVGEPNENYSGPESDL
jgi:hypothetical protein